MLKTLWATVRDGQVQILDSTQLPEGSRLLATLLPDEETESEFWVRVSQRSLDAVWDNDEDDVYATLLQE